MNVVVEKVGNRIYLRSPYTPEMPARCKALGGRWSKASKSWTYPLDLEMCRKLRDEFGDDLTIGEELWEWAAKEKTRERKLHAAADVKDMDVMAMVELPRVMEKCPGMWEAMTNRPYQPVASQYIATARQALIGDQPGIGKTIETLGALVEAGKKGQVLVLAPKTSCHVVWGPEIERWLESYADGFSVVVVAGMSGVKLRTALEEYHERSAANPDALHFIVANAEMARVKKDTHCPAGICDGDEDWCPEIEKHKNKNVEAHPWLFNRGKQRWSAIIADETHKWLINTRGKSASQVGYGFTKLKTQEDNFRVAMTGTPLKGKKHNIFGTINWLRPDVYTSKWRWVGDYFEVEEGDYGGKTIHGLKESREDAFFRSLKAVMIRRTKRELRDANPAWMPPDKVYHDVWVDMSPKQAKVYKAMEKDAEVELKGGKLDATGTLAEFTRLKQFASCSGEMDAGKLRPALPSCKFDWLLQFLEDRGIEQRVGSQRNGDLSDDVQKVVVASQFTQFIELWSAELTRLGIRNYMLTGKTKDRDRVENVNRFQTRDDVRVFLINTNAGGVSITLDSADDIVLMDETWVPDEQEQVEDRVHRASNVEHQVDVWYVRTKDTVEEGIAQLNEDKGQSNHIVLDAQRGLAFARATQYYKDKADLKSITKKKGK